MSSMATVNPRLDWFVGRMRRKLALKKNQTKSDWRGLSPTQNMNAIHDEVGELADAFDRLNESAPVAMRQAIIDECADVANRAMMLADQINKVQP